MPTECLKTKESASVPKTTKGLDVIVIGFTTETADGYDQWAPEFKAPDHFKSEAVIARSLARQQERFMQQAADLPFTGRVKSAVACSLLRQQKFSWDRTGGAEEFVRSVWDFISQSGTYEWPRYRWESFEGFSAPVLLGFDVSAFCKLLAAEMMTLTAAGTFGDSSRLYLPPLRFFRQNGRALDPYRELIACGANHVTISKVLSALGIAWKSVENDSPQHFVLHKDPEEDVRIAIELVARTNMLPTPITPSFRFEEDEESDEGSEALVEYEETEVEVAVQ